MAKKLITVKITGLKKIKKDFKKALNKIPRIVGIEYRKLIIKNLELSKKTGALIKSWKLRVRKDKVELISRLPYAEIQNYGGRITITPRMRKKMWALFASTGLPMYKAIAITKKNAITIKAKNYYDVNQRELTRNVDAKLRKITRRI